MGISHLIFLHKIYILKFNTLSSINQIARSMQFLRIKGGNLFPFD